MVQAIINHILSGMRNEEISSSLILAVLLVVTILAIYEFVVYQVIMRRSLYNRALNICMAILPYFIATIILCLQSNFVITLGTIGALAIIRFRTAVKDPVDLLFILWAIHIGITCGCQLYGLAIITSILVTFVLLFLNVINFGKHSHILVVHTRTSAEEDKLLHILKEHSKKFRVKSRNYTEKGMDYVFELVIRDAVGMTSALETEDCAERFSLVEYDTDDVL